VYFTGIDASGTPGVFKVRAASGNAEVATLAAGSPFVTPLGIATSTDGGRLYVADPGAGDASGADAGEIFWVDAASGASGPVAGGEATLARGLDVVRDAAGTDLIVFAGADRADGKPGVFKLAAHGGQVSVVAKGSPLVDPSGVAIADDGRVFVCDTLASPDKTTTVFKIEDGFVAPFFTGLHAGYPCGLALTRDGQTLFVIAKSAETGMDEVVGLDAASAAVVTRSAGIAGHTEAGGLHRARGADAFAFVEGSDQGAGAVFLLKR
jgi:DNA-binding beta-propeller fold protein YncE